MDGSRLPDAGSHDTNFGQHISYEWLTRGGGADNIRRMITFRKNFAALATTLAVASAPILIAAPAHATHADTPGCVTKSDPDPQVVREIWSGS